MPKRPKACSLVGCYHGKELFHDSWAGIRHGSGDVSLAAKTTKVHTSYPSNHQGTFERIPYPAVTEETFLRYSKNIYMAGASCP